jgi:predicted hydrocarbon binding protein
MVRVMRIISKRKIVEKLLENYGERGTGIFKLIDFDEKRMTARISVKNSHFAAGYQKSKEPVCYAMAGCLAGGGEIVFRKNMACRETKCAAMGEDHCEFEAFPEPKKAG